MNRPNFVSDIIGVILLVIWYKFCSFTVYTIAYFRICDRIFQHFCAFCPT